MLNHLYQIEKKVALGQNNKAIIIAADENVNSPEIKYDAIELSLLAKTLGLEVVDVVYYRLRKISPSTYIGKGTAESTLNNCKVLGCSNIILNVDISPSQIKNLQNLAGYEIKVYDRSGIIIEIFSRHAKSKEAKTQVQLAKLQYLLPRLTRQWTHLERQMGGVGTTGGPGEKQIEIDRRLISNQIKKLKSDLKKIDKNRDVQMDTRENAFNVSLVGYTNAGKSTLMKALTGTDVYIKDELFATLDSTTRIMKNEGPNDILISDTVGFIQKIPHSLIDSFKSTLKEIIQSNLLLKVIDISSENFYLYMETIDSTLADIECKNKESILVFNKIDLIDEVEIRSFKKRYPNAVFISAFTNDGINDLISRIVKLSEKQFVEKNISVKHSEQNVISFIYDTFRVVNRSDKYEHIEFHLFGSESNFNRLRKLLK